MDENEVEEQTRPPDEPGRRGFLAAAAAVLLAVPILGPLLLALRVALGRSSWQEPKEHPCLPLAEIPEHGLRRFRLRYRRRVGPYLEEVEKTVFLRRNGTDVLALDAECTHKGCPVRYREPAAGADDNGSLACPCHGGLFDVNGAVLDGPPPGPLKRFRARVPADPKQPVVLEV